MRGDMMEDYAISRVLGVFLALWDVLLIMDRIMSWLILGVTKMSSCP